MDVEQERKRFEEARGDFSQFISFILIQSEHQSLPMAIDEAAWWGWQSALAQKESDGDALHTTGTG